MIFDQCIRSGAVAALFIAAGMTVLSGCNTTGGSVRMQEGYALKSITLSDGTVFTPQATPKSDCDVLNAEVARMDEIVKPDFETFIKKGKPELSMGLYYMQINEGATLCTFKKSGKSS